jgi:hypothetical protein
MTRQSRGETSALPNWTVTACPNGCCYHVDFGSLTLKLTPKELKFLQDLLGTVDVKQEEGLMKREEGLAGEAVH